MASQTVDLQVQIVRFVLDHQPPIVACEFVDAGGRQHTIIDKVWMFSEETLNAHSQYPQPGLIRCTVLEELRDTQGRELVKIDVANPDQIESAEGLTEFTVVRGQVSPSTGPINVRQRRILGRTRIRLQSSGLLLFGIELGQPPAICLTLYH